jgi:FixJ family two-component response regulator
MQEASSWIAIVDDDPSVLKALSRALHFRGLRAKTYRSAQEFLATLPEGLPQCLIVDLQMPEMTGLELHDDLRRRGVQIRTIMITAHGDRRTQDRSEAAGISAFLSKPLRKTALFEAIDKLTGRVD